MNVLFIAGGIASGKSFIARELERLGAVRIDLDELSRSVLAPGHPCLSEVARAFGEDLLDADGALDRALLAERAFSSEEATQRLEAIEHPFIKAELMERLAAAKEAGAKVCVVEVPLLDRMEELLSVADAIVAVTCPIEQRLERAIARGTDEQSFYARMAQQPSDEYLEAAADIIFDNSGTAEDASDFARELFARFSGEAVGA